jgi:hypothetical protein
MKDNQNGQHPGEKNGKQSNQKPAEKDSKKEMAHEGPNLKKGKPNTEEMDEEKAGAREKNRTGAKNETKKEVL